MKSLSFATFFIAIFMLAAFSTQSGVVSFQVPAAVAGDDDSKSKSKSDEDSKSKSKSDEDSKSKSKSDEDSKSKSKSDEDSKSSASNDDDDDKVVVCHSSGNSGSAQTLSVDESAITAHIGHGDSLGECSESEEVAEVTYSCECPPGVACTCADGTAGQQGGSPTAAGPSQFRSF